MSATATIKRGPRVTLRQIEDEINKAPLTRVSTSSKKFTNKKNITIEGFDFTVNKADVKMCTVTDCENVTIRRCIFRDKDTLGVALNVTGVKTKKVLIEYCLFENLTFDDDNGGEPLRLGNSQHSGCIFECTVRNCIFRNLAADPETISIKSCKNTVEDCYFMNNKSNVTVRHGGLATIRHNYFKEKGGIRLYGYGNEITNNLFEDNPGEEKYAPIIVANGNKPRDPNWEDDKTPTGKEGNSHAIYAQNKDNKIHGNRFKNCKITIYYRKSERLKPKDLKLDDNLKVDKFGDDAGPAEPIPSPDIELEEPNSHQAREIDIPPQPEPDPATQPTEPDIEPYAKLCQGCETEEAKYKVSIHICASDLKASISAMKNTLAEIKRLSTENQKAIAAIEEEQEG